MAEPNHQDSLNYYRIDRLGGMGGGLFLLVSKQFDSSHFFVLMFYGPVNPMGSCRAVLLVSAEAQMSH